MISILMPMYNGIEFLEESVQSVLNQSFQDWELILGINGHPAHSDVYLQAKKMEELSPKIKVVDLFWIKGKSNALNEMLKMCLFDYVALLDVDDKWEKDKLQIQSPYLGDYDVVGTRCVYFGEQEGTIPFVPLGDITAFSFRDVNPIINSSSITRKALCHWDNSVEGVEDYDMWLRLWRSGCKFYNCPQICVQHRIHASSAFNNSNALLVPALIQKYFS